MTAARREGQLTSRQQPLNKASAESEGGVDKDRKQAINRVRELRRPLPDCWKFDRDEANRR
ncbi:hypothetical protein SAZ10_09155 [Mesorhizobium sp. BAC0120]|uniref:hypothetical protein n=1 Tax=Mesorhizobium sp. BAC0120 TaxID=3090670 RepID=UPI00298C44AF|nr:hypothetical protein [Mesorhizobium sp. BAC0120]MDW6021929.1 hypothetical protein [Mesorhizobium sp. BAC0120]